MTKKYVNSNKKNIKVAPKTEKQIASHNIFQESLQKNIIFPTKFPTKNLEKFVGKRISNEFSNKKKFIGNSSSEIFPTKHFNFCWKFATTFFSLENSLKNS